MADDSSLKYDNKDKTTIIRKKSFDGVLRPSKARTGESQNEYTRFATQEDCCCLEVWESDRESIKE